MTKFGYAVEIDSVCVYSESSDEKFGSWSESYNNEFKKITKTNEYPDIVTNIDFQIGETAFLVWVEYSRGNSFGCADREGTEIIGLFKSKEVAQELINAIEYHDRNDDERTWDERYKFYHKTSDGQEFSYGFVPWAGYFEYLDEIHCEEVCIEK